MTRSSTRPSSPARGHGRPKLSPGTPGQEDPSAAPGAGKLAPGLYLVATPIGNLEDLSRRAERIIATADVLACEDRRMTSRLLAHLGVRRPLAPAISDPGFKLVRAAREQGVPVYPVPGPSAVLAALVASGLPTDRFLFQGFLPPRSTARRRVLGELARVPATLVFYESPQRLAECLADATEVLGARAASVAREITKLHEEHRRGTLEELAAHYAAAGPPRGEVVLVVAPPDPDAQAVGDDVVDEALREALREAKPRQAAAAVAAATGRSANELYRRALTLARPTE